MKTLIIDNYDSMTFNLFQFVSEVNGCDPLVLKNDEASWDDIQNLDVDNIIVSPGPGSPERDGDFGVSRDAILNARCPLLGVCLGHQGIGYLHGARIAHAPEPMHGRVSQIGHNGSDLFHGMPSPISVVRYHSLMLAADLPGCLERHAWTDDGVVMGIKVKSRPVWGVQFHPESICTEYGKALLANFKRLTEIHNGRRTVAGRASHSGRRIESIPAFACEAGRQAPRTPLAVRHRALPFTIDCETAFATFYNGNAYAFWLDSSRVDEGLSRFSFMGDAQGQHAEVITYNVNDHKITARSRDTTSIETGNLFSYLRARIDAVELQGAEVLPFDFTGGLVGYLGYELQHDCGTDTRWPARTPDAAFIKPERFLAVDHLRNTTWLVHVGPPAAREEADEWFTAMAGKLERLQRTRPDRPDADNAPGVAPGFGLRHNAAAYRRAIRDGQQKLRDGESYEICLTNEMLTEARYDNFSIYRQLRRINPAPYAAYLKLPGAGVMCSSPERFLKIDRHGRMEAKPIKGTCRRATCPDEDRRLAEQLHACEKERAENLMIVDLLRNDLGLVSRINSVSVPKLMAVESYATVHQLVSTVSGRLHDSLSPVDAVRAAFPGGSMTGSPKRRTLDIIDELEQGPRGVYSGAIGYLSFNGAVDLNIVIRSIVADPQYLSIGCGGAITVLSDPDKEFDEIMLKARAPMQAIALAATGRADAYHVEEPADDPARPSPVEMSL